MACVELILALLRSKKCHHVEICVDDIKSFSTVGEKLGRLGLGVKCGSVKISKLKCTLLLELQCVWSSIRWELTYHLCIIDTKFDVFNFFLSEVVSTIADCADRRRRRLSFFSECSFCTRKLHFIWGLAARAIVRWHKAWAGLDVPRFTYFTARLTLSKSAITCWPDFGWVC